MQTTTEHKPAAPRRRRKRRPGPSSRPCPREGCSGLTDTRNPYCSFICGAIAKELDRTQRICEALGTDSPMAVELWTEAVALSDGWSRHIELDRRLYRAAISVGFTKEQWQAIKNGS